MGQQHNEMRRGDVSRALKAALGDTREGGIERYGETLTPTIDLWTRPDWAVLRGESLKGQWINNVAVVGQNGAVALVNLAGRNRLVVVEAAGVAFGSGASSVALEIATDAVLAANLATSNAGPSIGRDTRSNPTTVFTRSGSFVGTSLGTRIDVVAGGTGQTAYFEAGLPVVLAPGFGLVMIAATVNVVLNAIFAWRERSPYAPELLG